jgi:N-acetylglucosamine kinase-like BadF-type ATPase
MDDVIGIDGGGTKTAAVILNRQGQVLGYGEGGPSTYGIVPDAVTQTSIADAARAAAEMAGIRPANFSAAFLGLGNVVSEMDRAAVREIALALGLTQNGLIGVDHDIRIALAGGLSGRPGIVVIAGTGTSCFGVNQAGASWRSGGWGPLIDDEGSSYWLGIQTMRAAVLDYDGRGERTLLTQLVCERLALKQMDELMNRLYAADMTRTQIAAMSPLVFDAVAQGDAVALRLIRRGCKAMADCALAVARKIGLNAGASELAIAGGLTNAGDGLLIPFREAVEENLPECTVKKAELIPAIGAAMLAFEMTGQPLDEGWIAAVKKSGRALGLVVD